MTIEVDNDDFLETFVPVESISAPKEIQLQAYEMLLKPYPNTKGFPKPLQPSKDNMSHSRIAQQIEVLTLLESTIGSAGKVTMTPTRVKIMSEHREGNAFNNQKHMIDLILQRHGMLPFTVELVPHG